MLRAALVTVVLTLTGSLWAQESQEVARIGRQVEINVKHEAA